MSNPNNNYYTDEEWSRMFDSSIISPDLSFLPRLTETRVFTNRELIHLKFSWTYFTSFHHGADGHNGLMCIGKLLDILKRTYDELVKLKDDNKNLKDDLKKSQAQCLMWKDKYENPTGDGT